MNSRRATPSDAARLHTLRRDSILRLAPGLMSPEQAHAWAAKGDLQSMAQRLQQTESWIAEIQGETVGWVAIRADYLDALYVDPAYARRGIGAYLLKLVERVLRDRGVRAIRADVSCNSEAFYLQQGYEPLTPRPPNDARPMRKVLIPDAG